MLPLVPTIDTYIVMEFYQDKKRKELLYRPYRVYLALMWLKENNHLYKDIALDFPGYWSDAIKNKNKDVELFLKDNSIIVDKEDDEALFGIFNKD
jgi:hypothetical protein